MEFFKDLGKKITNASQEVVKKTQDMADTMKLNGEISNEEKKINSAYFMIGQKYFELHSDSPDIEFKDYIESIKNSTEKIAELKQEILKKSGKKTCPQCNGDVEDTATFCPNCGAKQEVRVEEFIVESEIETVETSKTCKNCNEALEENAVFCSNCGTKVE